MKSLSAQATLAPKPNKNASAAMDADIRPAAINFSLFSMATMIAEMFHNRSRANER